MENRTSVPGNALTNSRLDSRHGNTTTTDTGPGVPSFTRERSPPSPSDTVTQAPSPAATDSSASAPWTVFISHASEDKATIAIPLREKLLAKGITAFVDEADMPPGTDAVQAMTHAMETARIGVIILSPEFVAKEWPMRELMHFLKRREECAGYAHSGSEAPTIIPCFYRLSVADLYTEPDLNRTDEDGNLLYVKTRFYDRMKNGEPEANVVRIKDTLSKLHVIMGVRNDFDANNDSSYLMSTRRGVLLDKLYTEIFKSVPEGVRMRLSGESPAPDATQGRNRDSSQVDSFRKWFPQKLKSKQAVLDFGNPDVQGHPKTPECRVKQYLLVPSDHARGIVSLQGMGGVGKSTIVKVLMSEDDVRQQYPDGMHLIKLGSDASNNELLGRIYLILERSGAEKKVQSLRERNDVEEVCDFFMTWFREKRCVFFIDDVWERSVNVQALSRLCDVVNIDGGNMILITTRERDIACLTPDTRVVSLDPRESRSEIARKMLCFHAGVAENTFVSQNTVTVPGGADPMWKILDICSGLPVSIAVAGKNIRKLRPREQESRVSVWARYLARLEKSRQKLLQQSAGSYGNLYATLATSLTFLDKRSPEERFGMKFKFSFTQMHRRLCVLQKQASVPNTMLMHLWETESVENADDIAEAFVEVGLGGHETVESECGWKSLFSLHDSVHDFAVWEARRHDEVAKAHDSLLEGYGSGHEELCMDSEDKRMKWWSRELEDDGYIHKQLCRHFVESGRKNELRKLLLTPLWVERQTEVNGMMRLKDDFEMGMNEAKDDEETREALSLIRSAIILSCSFVMRNMRELWFQVRGRLIECVMGNRVVEEYVKRMETDTEKPRVLSVNGVLAGAGGRNTRIISVGNRSVVCMSLFPDEERVACGCRDGSVVVVDIRRSAIEREWQAYERTDSIVTSIAVAHNGTRIVTMSYSGALYAWNMESGNDVRKIWSHHNINCFAMTHDGRCVVCGSREGSLGWLHMRSGEKLVSSINVEKDATDIALLKDGERAIILYEFGMPKLWNIRTGEEIGRFGGNHDYRYCCMAVTPDERRVVICRYNFVTLWDLESRHQIWSQKEHEDAIMDVAVSKDGSRIVTRDSCGVIRIRDLESGDQICTPLKHRGNIQRVSFMGNKDFIVSCSLDGTVRVWSTTQGQHETSFEGHRDSVNCVSFTPDGKHVVTGSDDRTLRIWDSTSGRMVGDALRGHLSAVQDVAVTGDGKFVLSVSQDKTVRVWDFESRDLLHTLEGHTHYVSCVAVTPKGDRAVTGSWDETVRVWDLEKMDGSHVVLEGHNETVLRVFVFDDGLRVISIDWENQIFVWRMETKEVMKTHVIDNAWVMSRSELFNLIGEDTVHDDAGLTIRLGSNQIIYGKGTEARVLATLDSPIWSWDLSPDRKTICLGLDDGQVAILKFDV